MPRDLTFGSLFAGIGGIDLGFERAGLTCKFQVEVDPFCSSVLAHHWPDVPRFGDVKTLDPAELPYVDVLVGGFPCQPFSHAGKRRAQEDPRHLWPEFARLVGDLRPEYVVGENVRGLCTRGLAEVLADLTRLGYDAEWQVISAAALGAPHVRDRIFIVAYAPGDTEQRQEHEAEAERAGGHPRVVAQVGGARRGKPEPVAYVAHGRGTLADADSTGLPDATRREGPTWPDRWTVFSPNDAPQGAHLWPPEPAVGRVADGVPAGLDRLRALGNAVVPQVAEYVGRLIVNHARRT